MKMYELLMSLQGELRRHSSGNGNDKLDLLLQ